MEQSVFGVAAPPVTFLILAGGQSRRMGTPKHRLPWGAKDLTAAAAAKGAFVGADETLVSIGAPYGDYRCVADVVEGGGPLCGIHAGLCAAKNPVCLLLPVDVPQFPGEIAREMFRFFLTQGCQYTPLCHGGKLEPLIALLRRDALPAIQQMLQSGEYRVHALLERVESSPYAFSGDADLIFNCNTPEAYRYIKEKYDP